MEPEEYIQKLGYDTQAEHGQVSRFYTNSKSLIARGGIYRPSPPYVHFHLNKSWDFLTNCPEPVKSTTLGIITSDLSDLAGHRQRLAFLEKLDSSGIDYSLWGRGERLRQFRGYRGFVPNKWDAHVQCRYTLVLENSVSPWYWTEKVADAILAYSLPLYHGCPRLSEYVPGNSFIAIDIANPQAITDVRAAIDRDDFTIRKSALIQARRQLLDVHNLHAFLDRELNG
jgi:hypothetical protein